MGSESTGRQREQEAGWRREPESIILKPSWRTNTRSSVYPTIRRTSRSNRARLPPFNAAWFARNLWWLLSAAFVVMVLPCGCCGGIFWWLIGSVKSSEPYQMALHRVQTASQVTDQLGEPIEESSWMPTGNFSYHTNNGVASGEASFDFNVAGPKGTAHVHAQARCRDGKWQFQQLQATPASTGKMISLPVEEKPEED